MIHPAETARQHISEALQVCQTDPSLSGTLELLVQNLAQAQGKLFPAVKLPADSAGSIDMMRKAMEFLAQALKTLQDIEGGGDVVKRAARAIALSLQTLHPLVEEAKAVAGKMSDPPEPVASRLGSTHEIDVNTALSQNTDHQFYNGFSENIEEGGIFVATFDPKPTGAKVLVNFKLPGGRPVTVRGVVHFVREYNPLTPEMAPGMGVRFTGLLEKDKAAIEKYLEQRAPMFYDD